MSGVHVLSPPSSATGDNPASVAGRRVRIPDAQEQAQRKAWGAKWGKLVAEASRQLKEGKQDV